ncbi:hypothetical protein C3B58_16705 [Lactonifactor longoviformis]|uniref:Uncharacterized protein n=1 Tax=Lactonifactor longoviformis DSM 17459 TaxID=1122155 RepID=A0A1M4Y1A8_9CLOT|nr:hypothetical protein [Lactonifactor longoviformis]POP31383.1 hypothetical protein C3B58_16705 [Lactonifactor longoviformis]SHE99617.1 hypothetical protein SAMN02745158_02201 [Lactonifactor longoviformis DSM 17459]
MRLEPLYHEGYGYKPLVLTENWQLAQLNYTPEQEPEALEKLDQHDFTDETFTLVRGRAFLIIYDSAAHESGLIPLREGITYNVPAMMWHNIAMERGSCVLITEGRDAHLKGFSQIPIPENLKEEILAFRDCSWI